MMGYFKRAFAAIIGQPDAGGSIDNQVLNAVAFFAALFSVFGGLFNWVLGMPASSVWPLMGCAVLLGISYLVTRGVWRGPGRRTAGAPTPPARVWNWLVYFLLMATLAFAWWVADGSFSPGYLLFFIQIGVAVVLGKGRERLAMVTLGIAVIIGLSYLEYIGVIVPRPYPTEAARMADLVFLTIMVSVALALINHASHASYERTLDLLAAERSRADALLHRMLPARAVARLKEGETRIAEKQDDVVVVVAELVVPDQVLYGGDPAAMLETVDRAFLEFDALAEQYGVEKIKTMGERYVAASGLLSAGARGHNDPAAVVRRAGEMALDFVEVCRRRREDGENLHVRVGMDRGPVVGGVIGTKRFGYDVWGTPVRSAEGLTARAEAGRILVTPALRDVAGPWFHFEPVGEDAQVYRLTGRGGGADAG